MNVNLCVQYFTLLFVLCFTRYYDPISSSGEPAYQICRILIEDCRVFRTKARAPSMIVLEVKRLDDLLPCVANIASGGVGQQQDLGAKESIVKENMSPGPEIGITNNRILENIVSSGPPSPMSVSRNTSAGIGNLVCPLPEEEVGSILGSKMEHTIADLHTAERRIHDKEHTNAFLEDVTSNTNSFPSSPSPTPTPMPMDKTNANTISASSGVPIGRKSVKRESVSLLSSHRKSVPLLSMLGA